MTPSWDGAGETAPSRPRTVSAVTLVCADLTVSHDFYTALGFDDVAHGSPAEGFISYRLGTTHLNLQSSGHARAARGGPGSGNPGSGNPVRRGWGRVIFHVDDVDGTHRRAVAAGYEPAAAPVDAPWGERFFHLDDPDGHELSFARPLA